MGIPWLVHMLLHLVSRFKPEIIFLMEVKVCRRKIEVVEKRISYENLFFVEERNNGGGLALLWNGKNLIHLREFSRNLIIVEVTRVGSRPWRLTSYYGHPKRNKQ